MDTRAGSHAASASKRITYFNGQREVQLELGYEIVAWHDHLFGVWQNDLRSNISRSDKHLWCESILTIMRNV